VPGAHLQQEELCARFGVSRTPVREALRKLQAQHLVQVIPNRGAMVRVPTRRDLQEVYVVRAELEGLACVLATPHVTADTIAQLAEAQEGVEAAIEVFRGLPMPQEQEIAFNARITQANEKFHGIIHQTADNEQLRTLINQLQWYFPKDAVWKAQRSSVDIRALNLDEHRAIQDAFAGRSGTKARKAMKSHILHAGSLLLSYLDELGFWS
jgi:DNA-binding GntR family transcriptional regulator